MAKHRPTELKTGEEKFDALCKWAKDLIPDLGKTKATDDPDPEQLVPEPCDCEHTNHGLHWKPARRTQEWADYIEALEEDDDNGTS